MVLLANKFLLLGTMWVQWQLIPTYGAVKWSYFTSPFGDPMLIVSNTRAPAVILTYDPLRGLFVPTQQQSKKYFLYNLTLFLVWGKCQ